MDSDPIGTAAREEKKARRLGGEKACILCGATEIASLTSRVLEEHHPLGRAHVPAITVTLCLNCHATASDAQVRAGVPLSPQKSLVETVIAVMRGLAILFEELASTLWRYALGLQVFVEDLDEHTDWRDFCQGVIE